MSSLPIPAFDAPRRVLLAAPRGYCAGVERAIDIVEVALATYGPPAVSYTHLTLPTILRV